MKSETILKAVCEHLNVNPTDVISYGKKKEIAEARNIFVYLAYDLSKMSFCSIAKMLSGRDHTTAIHSNKVVKQLMEIDESFADCVNAIRNKLLGLHVAEPKKPVEIIKPLPKIEPVKWQRPKGEYTNPQIPLAPKKEHREFKQGSIIRPMTLNLKHHKKIVGRM
jgi:hypothetical protein